MDSEGNVRLGDFGLATKHRASKSGFDETDNNSENESDTAGVYGAIDDISRLLGGSAHASLSHQSSLQESMTGGVGKPF